MKKDDNIEKLKENGILVMDDFLSSEECDEILFLIESEKWNPSMVVSLNKDNNTVEHFYSETRTSKTLSAIDFNNKLKKLLLNIELNICKKYKIRRKKIEGWQISRYGYNEKFEPHLDCLWENGIYGVRDKTILLYLMSPSKGGETFFRAHNLHVKPVKGRLVIWNNLLNNGSCNYAMIHGSLPVKKGIKIILNTWIHL